MTRVGRFLQLFGLCLMPAALVVGFSNVPRSGEMELLILMAGAGVFGLGRMVEKNR